MPPPEMADPVQASWDALYDFLDPQRPDRRGPARDAEAEARYRDITRRLVCFFAGRGCCDAEDLAAETILRVAAKSRTIDAMEQGSRTAYFYGVARNVHHEWHRQTVKESALRDAVQAELSRTPLIDLHEPDTEAMAQHCLDQCLARLTHRARRLVQRYYRSDVPGRAADHQALASEFGKSINALRIEVHRTRKTLRQCVATCLSLAIGDERPSGRPP